MFKPAFAGMSTHRSWMDGGWTTVEEHVYVERRTTRIRILGAQHGQCTLCWMLRDTLANNTHDVHNQQSIT